ncbi:hypothetical protein KLGR111401_17075 [Klebsiella grimontii]
MNRTYLSTKACGLSNLVAHSQKQIHHSGRIIVVGPVHLACQEGCYVC